MVYKIRTHTYTHACTHKHTPLPHGDKEPPLSTLCEGKTAPFSPTQLPDALDTHLTKEPLFFHFLPKYVVFARMAFRSTLLMYIAVLQYIGVPSVDEGPATRRGRKARPARRVTSSHSL